MPDPQTSRRMAEARESLEESAVNFVEQMAKAVHGPKPSSRQIADITRIVVANTSVGKYL